MKPTTVLEPEFVVSVPNPLQQGVLYVSMEFATVIHLCVCGCGNKVVTPLKRAGWELLYTEDGVSLYPSIGCWAFTCRSHYWIRQNRIIWSSDWSDEEVRSGREETKRAHLLNQQRPECPQENHKPTTSSAAKETNAVDVIPSKSLWARLLARLMHWW